MNGICTGESKCKDCDDRYTAVLEQVQALPIQWQMEIADTVYQGQGLKTRADVINDCLEIFKNKIIEKMEQLNKKIKNAEEIEAIFGIKQLQILQELLEEDWLNEYK